MGKVHSLQSFPVVGGQIILKDIVLRSFDHAEENGYLKPLIGQILGKKEVGGGLAVLQ